MISPNNEIQKTEIIVKRFAWKQKMLITGHYEFEIVVKNLSKSSERTIYRRFSDIEWLHEGLLKYNPGCRIPSLPEKNIWTNLNVNNEHILEKRRKLIEEYLDYINSHKYLSINPNFVSFLSDGFDKNRNETGKQTSLLEKFSSLTSLLPSVFKQQKMKGLSVIEDNKKLEKDRENLVRLLKAVNDLNYNMAEYVKINDEKTESIKNILFSARNIQFYDLHYNSSNNSARDDNYQQFEGSKSEKNINKNLDIINVFYEKNKTFHNLVVSSVTDQLEKYVSELKGLIEIFDRKEKEEAKLNTLQKDRERTEEKENELNEQKFLLESMNEQLELEISNFKLNRENDLLEIIKKFFRNKAENNNDIKQIFN